MINDLFEFLRRTQLTSNSKVSLCFFGSMASFDNPKLVAGLTFYTSVEFRLSQPAFKVLSSYSNLTVLNIFGSQLDVGNLKALPMLKSLAVGSLCDSTINTEKFEHIKSLFITEPVEDDIKQLPEIVSSCFPLLVYFEFRGNKQAVKENEPDFSGLPATCKFLSTEIEFIRYFLACCKNLQYINIFYSYSYYSMDLLNALSARSLSLQLLKISFDGTSIYSLDLLQFVLFLLRKF